MENDVYVKILLDGTIIGGIILEWLSEEHIQLIRIWIHPDHQDKKIGHKAMQHIHNNIQAKK